MFGFYFNRCDMQGTKRLIHYYFQICTDVLVNSNNLLNKSSGDKALVGASDDARRSRGGTLKARNDGANGGTLTARDGARDQSKHTEI